MNSIKNTIKTSLYKIGVFDLIRRLQKNRVIILMYHRFSDKVEPFKLQKNVFENQIKFLKRKYNFVSLEDYTEVIIEKKSYLPPNPVIVTIDDGYWDSYTFAYPILKKYSIPATIFLATDFINHGEWLWSNKLEYILKNSEYKKFNFTLGKGREAKFDVSDFSSWHKTQLRIFNYCRTIPNIQKDELIDSLAKQLKVDVPSKAIGDFLPLTWDQIREMSNYGITFGSHSCSHPILSRLTEEELVHEIKDSKWSIEKNLGKQVVSFCYPNGTLEDFNSSVVMILQNFGYKTSVTTIPGHNNLKDINPFYLKRLSVIESDHVKLLARLIRS